MIASIHNGLTDRQKLEALRGNYRARNEKLTDAEVEELFSLAEELLRNRVIVHEVADEDDFED